ncbi:MAG: PIN domain-containing protein [Cytophagaceae bacterium]|nr:PIN domain-containing protein [Cytophagaceae bacterium]MBK9511850.1 PIN domain-containing protein [Cytophagaceae bacterium]MBK9934596.1 PIN domain-containing protein [Cytophagaceae bacterium]MBL0301035.1 PIN domain-containing protein [Cytophagaceae bacterium]MBL0323854.1 PIN domain-containing protein [Cytophagaceae bacterium]
MKKVFLDTNIVLDLLEKRLPFYINASKIFYLAEKKQITISVSSLTFANLNYILSKKTSINEARQILRKLRMLIDVISLSEKVIDLALNDLDFKDFEDALQFYSAMESKQNVIITRNQRDFPKIDIPIMNPEEYLASI